jgi:5-methylcytosine-specific restriction endonuclease McrA
MKYEKKKDKEIKDYLEKSVCSRCGGRYNLTLDHIIPISFLMQQLGMTPEESFDWDNFQAMCRKCNTLKAGRFDLSNPKTKQLIIKYANRYC